jgi:hypothetical protein
VAAALVLTACSSNVAGLKTAPLNTDAYNGNLTLNWVGNTLITIGINKNAIGKVQLMAGDQPVAGATISFTTDGNTGGAYLQQNTDTTDGDGYATVNILAQGAASFRVGATTEGLQAPSYVNVEVNGKYLGDVVVRADSYTGPAKPTFYFVRLHNANTQGGGCATFNPNFIPPAIDTQQVADIRLDTLFSNEQDKLSVYATIVGMSGTRPVLYGCGGPVTVVGQERVTINVELNTATADLRGDYTFGQQIEPLSFLDQGSLVAVVLHDITTLIEDPGDFLAGDIWTLDHNGATGGGIGLCTLLGASASSFCATVAKIGIDAAVTAMLAADPTGTATNIDNDLKSGALLLTNLDVGGVMTIKDYAPSTGAIDGTFVYDSYRFLWTGECANSQDPCCGHDVLDGAKLGIQPFQANFTGTVLPLAGAEIGYTFNTNSTELGLAYGRLAMAILEDFILPAIPGISAWDTAGPNNSCSPSSASPPCPDGKIEFGELIAGIANCNSATVIPGAGTTAVSACQTAAWALGSVVDNLVSQLQFNGTSDWNIHEQVVNGTLVDTDQDLQVDTLHATLQMTAEAGSNPTTNSQDFDARYKGTVCSGDGNCGSGFACHFAPNAVDACFTDNSCGAAVGQSLGDTACTYDTDCKSGTCSRATGVANAVQPHPGYCYQACASDADCLGNGHCDTKGYLVVEDTGTVPGFLDPQDSETVAGMCVH